MSKLTEFLPALKQQGFLPSYREFKRVAVWKHDDKNIRNRLKELLNLSYILQKHFPIYINPKKYTIQDDIVIKLNRDCCVIELIRYLNYPAINDGDS